MAEASARAAAPYASLRPGLEPQYTHKLVNAFIFDRSALVESAIVVPARRESVAPPFSTNRMADTAPAIDDGRIAFGAQMHNNGAS